MLHPIALPIDSYLPQITKSWESAGIAAIIIKATPGSGKTTRVPWHLSKKTPQKILVLEPRRLAAKLAAGRVAQENGLQLGKEVGYVFRYESQISEQTRLIFLTEGTFLRQMLSNPQLEGISTVVLDEFHERHLETDGALALIRCLQKGPRPDLKLVIMSATLETRPLEDYLGQFQTVEIKNTLFPLTLNYLPHRPEELNLPLEKKVYQAMAKCWEEDGDILVFLPGMREIRRVQEHLGEFASFSLILHGDLSSQEQSRVLSPSDQRKIILSTNIAESSVTIPGIQIV
ncbi:MAG: DEAD/DEAH box helicase, partial [Pseudomonadota bacterium]